MTDTPSIHPTVITHLEHLVTAARGTTPTPPTPDQAAALVETLEVAILDRPTREAYLNHLLRLWARQPPEGTLLEEDLVARVRATGLKAVPADRLARLAVEPTAVLDLRDVVHGDELPAYWFDRLRELHPSIGRGQAEFLRRLAGAPDATPEDVNAGPVDPKSPARGPDRSERFWHELTTPASSLFRHDLR